MIEIDFRVWWQLSPAPEASLATRPLELSKGLATPAAPATPAPRADDRKRRRSADTAHPASGRRHRLNSSRPAFGVSPSADPTEGRVAPLFVSLAAPRPTAGRRPGRCSRAGTGQAPSAEGAPLG